MTQRAMAHTPECDAAYAAYQAELKAYEEKWPNHCRHCGGTGGFYSPGNREQPPDFDTCGECVEKAKCPRCGDETFTDMVDVCTKCGFNLDKPQEVKPEFECICPWEE